MQSISPDPYSRLLGIAVRYLRRFPPVGVHLLQGVCGFADRRRPGPQAILTRRLSNGFMRADQHATRQPGNAKDAGDRAGGCRNAGREMARIAGRPAAMVAAEWTAPRRLAAPR